MWIFCQIWNMIWLGLHRNILTSRQYSSDFVRENLSYSSFYHCTFIKLCCPHHLSLSWLGNLSKVHSSCSRWRTRLQEKEQNEGDIYSAAAVCWEMCCEQTSERELLNRTYCSNIREVQQLSVFYFNACLYLDSCI